MEAIQKKVTQQYTVILTFSLLPHAGKSVA